MGEQNSEPSQRVVDLALEAANGANEALSEVRATDETIEKVREVASLALEGVHIDDVVFAELEEKRDRAQTDFVVFEAMAGSVFRPSASNEQSENIEDTPSAGAESVKAQTQQEGPQTKRKRRTTNATARKDGAKGQAEGLSRVEEDAEHLLATILNNNGKVEASDTSSAGVVLRQLADFSGYRFHNALKKLSRTGYIIIRKPSESAKYYDEVAVDLGKLKEHLAENGDEGFGKEVMKALANLESRTEGTTHNGAQAESFLA